VSPRVAGRSFWQGGGWRGRYRTPMLLLYLGAVSVLYAVVLVRFGWLALIAILAVPAFVLFGLLAEATRRR